MALIENIQRENLNSMEIAAAIDFLIKQHDLTHEEIAHRIGKAAYLLHRYTGCFPFPQRCRNIYAKAAYSLVTRGRL